MSLIASLVLLTLAVLPLPASAWNIPGHMLTPFSLFNVDPRQIEQVLVNLYLNSSDAMPDGGRLTIETKNVAEEVSISVTDTGFGIEDNDLPKLFQPFFTSKKKSGLGLGLAICDRIIRNHGGRIEVASQVGQGTTFRIYLPLAR